ncbi:hypothetical protein MMC07_006188 [Pseudocyphellaria aurata]|nr:hypothetical protein [Pseudocyphellaria aurata]
MSSSSSTSILGNLNSSVEETVDQRHAELKEKEDSGQADLGDLRRDPESGVTTSDPGTMSSRTGGKSSVETDQGVKQPPTSHSTRPHHRTRKPRNWSELKRTLASRRTYLASELSNGAFEAFKRAHDDLCSKTTVMRMIFPFPFNGPDEIPTRDMPSGDSTPVINDIRVEAKSDFCDGEYSPHIDRRLREALASCIIPFAHEDALALPNYFVKVRGPDESRSAALTHAFHDGIIGARAIHRLRSHGTKSDPSAPLHGHRAYTLTACYDRGRLTLYAVHPHRHHPLSPARPHYELHRLHDGDLTASRSGFLHGITALRNGLDWARAQRRNLIGTGKVRAIGMPG